METIIQIRGRLREIEGNVVDFMAHEFKLLSLVYHDRFHNLTKDIKPRLHPFEISKISRSIVSTEKQLVERSGIESLEKLKTVVNQLRNLDESQEEGNFLVDGSLLHSSR